MATNKMLRMRELERATGVGRETIRYYIRERLLPDPERLGRNVALYDESFVERIRLIKELQRTRFLPLQVIKAVLDSGTAPSPEQTHALRRLEGRVFATAASTVLEPAREVAARTGASEADVRALARAGVIAPHTASGGQELLDPEDTEIVSCWAALRAAGFSDELEFSPADLSVHAGMLDVLVDEELRMFTGRTARNVGAEGAARMAEAGVEQVNRILGLMRRKKILEAIGNAGAAVADSQPLSARRR